MHSGCVRQSERNRDEYTMHKVPGSLFFLWYHAQTMFLEKNSVTAAKFVDSWKYWRLNKKTTRLFFPRTEFVLSYTHLWLNINRNCFQISLAKGCWVPNLLFSSTKFGEWKWVKSLYLKGQIYALIYLQFLNYWVCCFNLFRDRC